MITHCIQFHDEIKKKSQNTGFLELSEEFCRDSKTSSISPSVFELLRFNCIWKMPFFHLNHYEHLVVR